MVELLRTQFMLVRGQQFISHYSAGLPEEQEAKMTESDREYLELELDIVVQVNGGLRSISKYFSIGKVIVGDDLPVGIGTSREGITLTDWRGWRDFCDIMAGFGYPLSESKGIESMGDYILIKKWIQEVFPDRMYVEDFEGTASSSKGG